MLKILLHHAVEFWEIQWANHPPSHDIRFLWVASDCKATLDGFQKITLVADSDSNKEVIVIINTLTVVAITYITFIIIIFFFTKRVVFPLTIQIHSLLLVFLNPYSKKRKSEDYYYVKICPKMQKHQGDSIQF